MERIFSKNVKIEILSSFKNESGDGKSEVFAEGTLTKNDGGYGLTYYETDETGYANCETVVEVYGDGERVDITRKGAVYSELSICRGKQTVCRYGTPYGDFSLGIKGDAAESNLNEFGGEIRLKYSLDLNASFIGENETKILVNLKNSDMI